MDALTHAIECYTMAYHQPFTDAVALHAMEYCSRWLRVAYSQGHNLEARYQHEHGRDALPVSPTAPTRPERRMP